MKARRFLGALGAFVALALAGAPAWAGGPAARLVSVVQPVSKAPSLASLPPPVFAMDLNVRVVDGYKGPLFRVANAGAVQRDCSTAACADAFVATTIIGGYDQVSTELVTFSTPLTYQKTTSGLVGGFVQTNASGARTMTLPAGLLSAYNAAPGATASLVMGMHTAAPAAALNLLNISTGTNAANARYGISLQTDFAMRINTRRLDADANALMDIGDFRGTIELTGATWDQNTGIGRAYRYGQVGFVKSAFQSTGPASATDALAATASVPIGGTFYSLALWNSPITTTQDKGLLAWQRYTYGHLRTAIADGGYSWWGSPNPRDNGSGKLLAGFSNAAGTQYNVEIDLATRLPTDWFVGTAGRWTIDDHNVSPVLVLNDGRLISFYVGHGNSITGTQDGLVTARVSPTGRIADFGDEIILPTNMTLANYGEGFAIGASDAVWITNDDSGSAWVPIRYTGGVFSQGVRLAGQSVAPGGGQNQLYDFVVKVSSDTLRNFFIPHTSNAQNSIRVGDFNATTGVFTSGVGGGTSFGSAWPGPGTSTALTDVTALSVVYTPASGKSARLLDVSADATRLLIVEFDTTATTNAVYYEVVNNGSDPFQSTNWARGPPLANAGVALWVSGGYFGGAVYANEPHSGVRIYLSREASGTWYIDKLDSADNGANFTTTNVASSASSKLVRPVSPVGSTTSTIMYSGYPIYDSYNAWRGRPIFVLVP